MEGRGFSVKHDKGPYGRFAELLGKFEFVECPVRKGPSDWDVYQYQLDETDGHVRLRHVAHQVPTWQLGKFNSESYLKFPRGIK